MNITRASASVAITSIDSVWQWSAVFFVLIGFVVFSLSRSVYVYEWYGIVIPVVGSILIGYIVWPAFRQLLFGSLLPFLVGWLVGVNWMVRWWGLSVDKVVFRQDAPLDWSSGRLLESDLGGFGCNNPVVSVVAPDTYSARGALLAGSTKASTHFPFYLYNRYSVTSVCHMGQGRVDRRGACGFLFFSLLSFLCACRCFSVYRVASPFGKNQWESWLEYF